MSAALAETEVEESRGSFVVKDRDVHLVCQHQTLDDIILINPFDDKDNDFLPDHLELDRLKIDSKIADPPVLVITGHIFSKRKKKRLQSSGIYKDIKFEKREPAASARYWVLFDQKNCNQIGFQVKIGQPNFQLLHQKASPLTASGWYRRLRRKLGRYRKRKLGWSWVFTRTKGLVTVSSSEEELGELNVAEPSAEFNRVCFTYASEGNERFFGFGEQFSRMDFKGKRVPIFVQEQGIGRGDQPITFAANLVSYRYELKLLCLKRLTSSTNLMVLISKRISLL